MKPDWTNQCLKKKTEARRREKTLLVGVIVSRGSDE